MTKWRREEEKKMGDKNNISMEKWEPTPKGRPVPCRCPSHAQNKPRDQISLAHSTQTLDTLSTPSFFSFSWFLLYIFHFVFNLNLFDFILFAFKFSKCFEITWRQNKCDINILEVMESFFVLVSHRRPDPAWCSARIRDKVTVGKKGLALGLLTGIYIYNNS